MTGHGGGGDNGGGGSVELRYDTCPQCGKNIDGRGLGNHLRNDCSAINNE